MSSIWDEVDDARRRAEPEQRLAPVVPADSTVPRRHKRLRGYLTTVRQYKRWHNVVGKVAGHAPAPVQPGEFSVLTVLQAHEDTRA